MSTPKFSLAMRGSGVTTNAEIEAAAGSTFTVEYDPLKASVSIDYSSEDHITIKASGAVNLKTIGLPSLTIGASVGGGEAGATVDGSIEWVINKNISAKAVIERSPTSTSGTMTLTIKF